MAGCRVHGHHHRVSAGRGGVVEGAAEVVVEDAAEGAVAEAMAAVAVITGVQRAACDAIIPLCVSGAEVGDEAGTKAGDGTAKAAPARGCP
mmetsp:Transcript_13942/g.36004  ORF Transcript_13942/g.36004 Transcript_13942/m.36004 type:complete len:91 (-) Transcript_13942:2791-3063(-)